MIVFEESGLQFEFNTENWEVIQYDTSKDFLRIRDAIDGTKGVDFIGILNGKSLAIFEVKNFRGTRIENKQRMGQGGTSLDVEFSKKVKDTVSGMIGASETQPTILNFGKSVQIY